MKSYTFLWTNETWDKHASEAKFGPVTIDYIAAANKRPFSEFVKGDEVFIVTVRRGNLYIGGRLIVGDRPMSREAASTLLVSSALIERALYVLADRLQVDSFRPSTMVNIEVAKNLDLTSGQGPRKPALDRNGQIDRMAFHSPYLLTLASAKELRTYLDLDKVSAASLSRKAVDTIGVEQSVSNREHLQPKLSQGAVDAFRLQADRLEKESAATNFLSETEVNAWVKQRLSQGTFRVVLFEIFGRRCPLSGLKFERLLIASHIQPWSRSDHRARQDPDNGLLLSVVWDALFDKSLITFDEGGRMLIAPQLGEDTIKKLGITFPTDLPAPFLTPGRQSYLKYHRERCLEAWAK